MHNYALQVLCTTSKDNNLVEHMKVSKYISPYRHKLMLGRKSFINQLFSLLLIVTNRVVRLLIRLRYGRTQAAVWEIYFPSAKTLDGGYIFTNSDLNLSTITP